MALINVRLCAEGLAGRPVRGTADRLNKASDFTNPTYNLIDSIYFSIWMFTFLMFSFTADVYEWHSFV